MKTKVQLIRSCVIQQISKEIYTSLSDYNKKSPTINNLSFTVSKLVKEEKARGRIRQPETAASKKEGNARKEKNPKKFLQESK